MNNNTQTTTWQPIETAPRDTPIIVFAVGYAEKYGTVSPNRIGEAIHYEGSNSTGTDDAWGWANDSCECHYGPMQETPRMWMPMPEAPAELPAACPF